MMLVLGSAHGQIATTLTHPDAPIQPQFGAHIAQGPGYVAVVLPSTEDSELLIYRDGNLAQPERIAFSATETLYGPVAHENRLAFATETQARVYRVGSAATTLETMVSLPPNQFEAFRDLAVTDDQLLVTQDGSNIRVYDIAGNLLQTIEQPTGVRGQYVVLAVSDDTLGAGYSGFSPDDLVYSDFVFFSRNNALWTLDTVLPRFDFFSDVAVNEGLFATGSNFLVPGFTKVIFFARQGGAWQELSTLRVGDDATSVRMIDLSAELLAVRSIMRSTVTQAGESFIEVFERDEATFRLSAVLRPQADAPLGCFGASFDLNERRLAIGIPGVPCFPGIINPPPDPVDGRVQLVEIPPPEVIPGISFWGLVLLAAAMGMVAVRRNRRY